MFRKYHRVKDTLDHSDKIYSFQREADTPDIEVPKAVDLREHCSPVENQLNTNSCTGNAIIGALEYLEISKNPQVKYKELSRLFVYYNERAKEGSVNYDQGASIRDGILSLVENGVCTEDIWPFDKNHVLLKPSLEAYHQAAQRKALAYQRLEQKHLALQHCLGVTKTPIVFGIMVYESLESQEVSKNGMVPMPTLDEKCLGGHAVLMVGYDTDKQHYIVRNSWGSAWGDNGYFYLPFDYVGNPNLSEDFWVVSDMQNE